MSRFKVEGKIIIFVSHALDTLKELCQRSLLLSKGRIATICNTEKVINNYPAIQSLMESGGVN